MFQRKFNTALFFTNLKLSSRPARVSSNKSADICSVSIKNLVTLLNTVAMLMKQKKWIHYLRKFISSGKIVSRASEDIVV